MIVFMPGRWCLFKTRFFRFERCYMEVYSRELGMRRPKEIPFCRIYFNKRDGKNGDQAI